MKRKCFLFSLVFLFVAAFSVPLQASVFQDVADDAWYASAVQYCFEKGYVAGMTDTTFEPETKMNRAMLVAMLYRCAGSPEAAGKVSGFFDVGSDTWYTKAVTWGAEKEIVVGYEDGTFRPTKAVSRQELMAFFCRYLQWKGNDAAQNANPGLFDAFPDGKTVAAWALPSVKWCVSLGLVCGSDGLLRPEATSTRAQIAGMLLRMDTFLAGKTVTISASAGAGGKVIPAGTFTIVEGSLITFRFQPDTGYAVEAVTVDGEWVGDQTVHTVAGNKPVRTLAVTFIKRPGDPYAGLGQLVNRSYPIANAPSYTPGDLKTINSAYSTKTVQLRSEAAAACERMIVDCRNATKTKKLKAQSGYRSYQYQSQLYRNQVARKGNNIYKAGVVSAIPGTSEHELGLAVDLTTDGTLLQSFGNTAEGKWLYAHCNEYGFILRYTYDKQMVTGIIYEPWHFRYVGKEIVSAMNEMGTVTLEEYYSLPLRDEDISPYAPYLR